LKKFDFDLQFFGGKGGGKSSSQQYRKRDPEEPELTRLRKGLYDSIFPNLEMYDPGRWIDAQNIADDALRQQSGLLQQAGKSNEGLMNLLETGNIPAPLMENMQGSVNRGLQSGMGAMLNSLGNRGVLNSSITGGGISDLSQKAANAMQDGYLNTFNSLVNGYKGGADSILGTVQGLSGLGQQAFTNAGAMLMPAYNMWEKAQSLYDGREDFDTVVTQKKGKK
jgi:hypothetical protein